MLEGKRKQGKDSGERETLNIAFICQSMGADGNVWTPPKCHAGLDHACKDRLNDFS